MATDDSQSKLERIDLLVSDWMTGARDRDSKQIDELCADHPHLMPELERALRTALAISNARIAAKNRLAAKAASDTATEPMEPPANDPESFVLEIPGLDGLHMVNRGAQGALFAGIQRSTTRKVAVKVLWSGMFATEAERSRFDRESVALALLDHPHIVRITDRGRTSAGLIYIVMDFVPGLPLDEYLIKNPQVRQNREKLLALFLKIAEAIEAAHKAKVIHRDLKPSNIRIDDAGNPRVLDFGLARIMTEEHASESITRTGQFVGSIPWVSPEQAEGRHSEVDCQSDIYSLGLLLFHMLTGEFPFDVNGSAIEAVKELLKPNRKLPSAFIHQPGSSCAAWIDPAMDEAVRRAIALRIEDRHKSVAQFIAAVVANEPIPATTVRPKSWRPHVIGASALLLVVAGVLLALQPFGSGVPTVTKFAYQSTIRSNTVGGAGGQPFEEAGPSPQVLAGLRVWTKSFSGNPVICGIQPIFRTSGGLVDGKSFGRREGPAADVMAPPDHAISSLRIRYNQRIDGFEARCRPISTDATTMTHERPLPWVGGPGGSEEAIIGGTGKPAVGIHGRAGLELDAIGLILAE